MEIVLGALAAGLLVCIIFSIKFIFEAPKKEVNVQEARVKHALDFKEDLDRQSGELKKALAELQRVESAYQEAKNNAQIVQKENAALAARLQESQKSRDDEGRVEQELKQKVVSLEGELVFRDKELNDRTKKVQELEKELHETETQGRAKVEMSNDLGKQVAHFKEDLDRQSGELKKALAELQRVESAYQEAKNNARRSSKKRTRRWQPAFKSLRSPGTTKAGWKRADAPISRNIS